MTKIPPPPAKPAKTASQLEREARAAAALRENLRRRKAQSRARTEAPPPTDSAEKT